MHRFFILLLCLLLGGSRQLLGLDLLPQAILQSASMRMASGLDDPEPDTLCYDDSGPSFSIGSLSNYYSYVRFTPPSHFSLRSIYIGIGTFAGNTLPCSLWVHLPNGSRPGTELASLEVPVEPGEMTYDLTLDEPIEFIAQQDFMIVVGRAPNPNSGWAPLLDGGSTVYRSYVTMEGRTTGFYQSIPYDFRIRAGGTLWNFADAVAEDCFNDVNGTGPAHFVRLGDSVQFKTRIRNTGTLAIPFYTATWTATDINGNIVYESESESSNLNAGDEQIVEAEQPHFPLDAGDFICTCRLSAYGDADTLNNATSTRIFVCQPPEWYGYDDWEMDGAVVHGQNWVIGVVYTLPMTSARIESVRVNCAASGAAGVRIYANDESDVPTETALWSFDRIFNTGWTTIAVDPPLILNTGASFTAGFVFNGTIALGVDYDPPNASSSTGMGQTAWLRGQTGWQADRSGNWMIQVFVSEPAAVPPETAPGTVNAFTLEQNYPNPFNPSTTIRYHLRCAAPVELTVYNLAGQKVATLASGVQPPGSHAILWSGQSDSGTNTAAGIYLCRLRAGMQTESRKMVLIR